MRNVTDRGTAGGEDGEKKVDVVNLWAKDKTNKDAVDELFAKHREANGLDEDSPIPVDQWRKITCSHFHQLPDDVKKKYEDQAVDLRSKKRKAKVLTGEERLA